MNFAKQKLVHLGESSYTINPFLTSKGLRVKSQLMKYLGSGLAEVFNTVQSDDEDDDNAMAIISLISTVFENIPEDKFVTLIQEILSGVYKNGQMIDFDKEFALNYANLYILVKEVLVFNYGDLFSLLGINAA